MREGRALLGRGARHVEARGVIKAVRDVCLRNADQRGIQRREPVVRYDEHKAIRAVVGADIAEHRLLQYPRDTYRVPA